MKNRRIFGLFKKLSKPAFCALVLCCTVFSGASAANSIDELYSNFKIQFPATSSNTVVLDYRHTNKTKVETSNATYTLLDWASTSSYANEFCVLYESTKGFGPNPQIFFGLSAQGTFRVRWGDGEIWKIEKTTTDLVFFKHQYPSNNESAYVSNGTSYWQTNTDSHPYGTVRAEICISRDTSAGTPWYSTVTKQISYDGGATSATVTTPAVIFADMYGKFTESTTYAMARIRSVKGSLANVFPVNTSTLNLTLFGQGKIPSFAGTFLGNADLGKNTPRCVSCSTVTPQSITKTMFNGINETTTGQFAFTFAGCYQSDITVQGSSSVFAGVSGSTQNYLFAGTFWQSGLTKIPALSYVTGAPKEGLFMATLRGNSITGPLNNALSNVITGSNNTIPAHMFQETFRGCSYLGTSNGTSDPSNYVDFDIFKNKFTNTNMGENAMHYIFYDTSLPSQCPVGKKEMDKVTSNEPYYTFSSDWIKSAPSDTFLASFAVSCENCPAGTYSDTVGNTCTVCSKDYYQPIPGSSVCNYSCASASGEAGGTDGVYPTTYSQSAGKGSHDAITDCLAEVTFKGNGGIVTNDQSGTSSQDWTVYAKYPNSTSYVAGCAAGSKTLCKRKNSHYRITDGVTDADGDGVFETEWKRSGFTFGGWYKESTLTNQVKADTDLTGNQTLYAKWYVTCAAGTYLPAGQSTCQTCPASCPSGKYLPNNGTECVDCTTTGCTAGTESSVQGFWCPGGNYELNSTTNQGINRCVPGHPYSESGNSAIDSCYITMPFYPGKGATFMNTTYSSDASYKGLWNRYKQSNGWFTYLANTEATKNVKSTLMAGGQYAPTKPGHDFLHWAYGTSATPVDGNTPIYSGTFDDRKFVAVYTPKQYNVTYSCGTGATGTPPSAQTITFGTTFNAASNIDCAYSGYNFSDWDCYYDDGTTTLTLQDGTTYNQAYNAVCTAKYDDPTTIAVKYICGATGKTTTDNIAYGSQYTFKTFTSFCNEPGYSYHTNAFICSDEHQHNGDTINSWNYTQNPFTCISPLYDIVNYNINYDLDNGALPQDIENPLTYTVETSVTFDNPERNNCEFVGWCIYDSATNQGKACANTSANFLEPYIEGSNPTIAIPTGSTGDRWVYAKWNCDINYDIQNDVNNPSAYVVEDTPIYLSNPTQYGHEFGGWCKYDSVQPTGGNSCISTDANYVQPQTNPASIIAIAAGSTGAKWFYSKWGAINYNVTYDCGTGTGTPPPNTLQTFGTNFTVANTDGASCSKTGYHFVGWACKYLDGNDGAPDTDLVNNTTYDIAVNALCTAQWDANTLYLQWNNDNGTTGITGATSCSYDGIIDPIQTVTRNGYNFAGWDVVSAPGHGTIEDKY